MARILIVEDEPLISMMLEEWLADLGHDAVGPVGTLDAAVQMASEAVFDAAILDINLRSSRSDKVAEVLLARNIPFAVSSGSAHDCSEPPFAGQPTIAKPYDYEAMQIAVAQLVDGKLNSR